MKIRLILLLLALGLASAPLLAAEKKRAKFSYEKYFASLKRMQAISEESNKNIRTLHKLMEDLKATKSDDEKASVVIRKEIRDLLTAHRKLKLEMIALCDGALVRPKPVRSDVDALRALRAKNLVNVNWNDTFLKVVAKEIADAIKVPINLANSVQGLNQVTLHFQSISAEAVMDIICSNFELKYVIYGGEINLFRRLNRNEERFLKYEKKVGHKIDWISEDEAGTYDSKDVPKDSRRKRKLKKLEEMDLPLLSQQMLKLYILEGESKRHELRLKELKLAAEFLDMVGKIQESKESEKDKEKRHRHVVFYVLMERNNAIEVWDVINRVLGDVLEVPEDDPVLREILKKEIASIEWKNVDVESALYELGRMAGFEVEVDIPPNMQMAISLSAENMTVAMVLDYICNAQNLDWRWMKGKIFVAYLGGEKDE